MFYTLVRNGDESNITVFIPGHDSPYQAHSSHPNFSRIIEIVVNDDFLNFEKLPNLFSVEKAVSDKFDTLSERVKVRDGQVYFDGDVVDNSLTKQIVRFLDEDIEDWAPLVNFMEKVEANPQEHSREQLYRWLERHDFTITPSGDFVGYKGVRTDRKSIHSGPAIVDGVEMNGRVPNEDGSVIEIARSLVHHDPAVGCSTGLHVGTYEYASSFGQVVLEVHVNPRDVVSVPTDCNDQKVRTCRYVVVEEIERKYDTAVTVEEADDDWGYEDEIDWDDDEVCEICGDPDCTYWSDLEDDDLEFEDDEEPEEETDANGFVINQRVRIVDDEEAEGYPYREGHVAANDNGFSSLTKVVWPDGDYDYFYAEEIEEVYVTEDSPEEEPKVRTYTGGYKVGDRIVGTGDDADTGVVIDDDKADPYIPVQHDIQGWIGYYTEDELRHADEEQVSYGGHAVGERWKQPSTGEIFRVVLRPDDPDEFGSAGGSIPLYNETRGTRDSIYAGGLNEDYGWIKLN